jgi:hypothetical protein
MTRRSFTTTFVFLSLIGLAGLLSTGCRTGKAVYSHDATVDFATVRSYAWATGSIPPQVASIVDFDYIDPRVRQGVDEELAAKGLRKATVATADVLLTYRLALTGEVSPKDLSGQMKRGPSGESARFIWTWDEYDLVGQEFVDGVLQVGMVGRESGKLIWWGSISTPIDIYEDMQRQRGVLRRVITKLLAPYPGRTTNAHE